MTANGSNGVRREDADGTSVTSPAGERSELFTYSAIITVIILILYLSSYYSYILFHSLVELLSIAIAFTLFIITWNVRRFLANDALKLLGIGYAFIAIIDLLHTLAYKGMNVFPGYDANLPTQLWIAARYLQAATLCAAPLCVRRKVGEHLLFGIYLATVALLAALVYSGHFPDCYIEGKGLTAFKVSSEYVITGILVIAFFLFHRIRGSFGTRVYSFIIASIVCTAASEISFTAYLSVYGFANMLGHLLKLAAFYFIYRALLVTGFKEPYDLIFRELKQAYDKLEATNMDLKVEIEERIQVETELMEARNALEARVDERTAALRRANEQLQLELADRKLAEAQLLQSEARLNDAQRIAHLGNWELDLASNLLTWSDEIYRIFEIDPEQFGASYDAFLAAIHPDDRELVNRTYAASVANHIPYDIVHRLLMKDGRIKYVNERCETCYGEDGRPLRSAGTIHDITERELAKDALNRLNERLEQRVAERTAELEAKNSELERLNRLFVDRELRMIELKKRINELEQMVDPQV